MSDTDRRVDDVETPEGLLEWAREYAAAVVAEHGLDVDLERVDWETSHRAKRRAGATVYTRPSGATVGDPVDARPACTVRLTWAALGELGGEGMAEVVRHELVHVEQVQRYGHTTHGEAFRQRAETVEAPLTCAAFTPARYRLLCTACSGLVARRYRRSKTVRHPERYRSGCCSAPLRVTDGEPE